MDSKGDHVLDLKMTNEDQKDTLNRRESQADGTVIDIDRDQNGVRANLAVADAAIDAIGFGKYHWQLVLSCGFGFLVDQMILVCISLLTPQSAMEFGPKHPTLLAAPSYAGLLVGAVVLGLLADNIGRRLVWHASIFGVSVFAMITASAPNWAALNIFMALIGFFGGGNLAIDLTILAESLPRKWSFILPGLASVWGLGNAITGLIAWPLLVNFGCPSGSTPATCSRSDNMGWRYLYIIIGGVCLIMAIIRALVLGTRESARWLISCGRVEEAVDVLNAISATNKSNHHVDLDQFVQSTQEPKTTQSVAENVARVVKLFSGLKQLRLMLCLIGIWLMIGIAYPLFTIFLPYYLAAHGADFGETSNYLTYRDWAVTSVVGIFGPFVSMAMLSTQKIQSRISMALTGIACAAFSGAFTSVKTAGENLAFSCMTGFWLNALYAIIYSYTPQALDVESRGLGCGLLLAFGRLSSLSSPFIATYADVTTSAPIWVSVGCYIAIGILALLLPLDTIGLKARA